ncbi:MAG: alpha-hydroxy-acid oxidizing protein [Acidobacteria bacterium]|nr:alpha-hydroxy-acid oxidizing protein [Acidobacteriota bacterium]
MVPSETSAGRRRFLKLLAASPLLAYPGLSPRWMEAIGRAQEDAVISSVREALDVFDFETVARKNLLPEHWAYLATGVDDDSTIRANREGFTRYQLRMRPLADFSKLDMSIQLFGTKWNTPIVLCPVASLKGFHTEGEKGVARAAKAKGVLQALSTMTSTPVEEVNKERGEPVWYQLYARDQWSETLKMVKRVEAAGCPALLWTVDLLGGSNRETFRRAQPREGVRAPLCKNCHEGLKKPMYAGLAEQAGGEGGGTTVFTWDDIKRLKDTTQMKLLVKGIQTREDAELAIAHGVDGIVVSNHGGRAGASGRATIESLPEIATGVGRRIPIILDSGIRRGTDIFKALALGATAVGIGRAYVFGLAAFGQEGVEAVLDILRRELQMVMRQTGATSVAKITRASLVDRFDAIPSPASSHSSGNR